MDRQLKSYRWQDLGRSQVQELLSLWSSDVIFLVQMCLTTQKVFEPCTIGIFMEAFSQGHQ